MSPAAPGPAITATGLRTSFGEKAVLDGVDLSVAEGTVSCLPGPDRAGKMTAVHILSTPLRADGDEVRVASGATPRARPGARRDRCHRPVLRGRRPAPRPGEPAADGRPGTPAPR
jgi:ABC-2 type transport system ATP-binding protein